MAKQTEIQTRIRYKMEIHQRKFRKVAAGKLPLIYQIKYYFFFFFFLSLLSCITFRLSKIVSFFSHLYKSSLRQQTVCKIPASPYAVQNHIAGNGSIVMNGMPATPTKHSMLDKLKLFKGEKSDRSSKAQISKRTSSSSGFSSARSERSDSSLSLNNDPNAKSSGIPVSQPPPSNLKKSEISTNTKTKSKLLSSSSSGKSSSKDTLTKKSEKKDKSPARVSADMSESKIAVPKTQKTSFLSSSSGKNESKLKMISVNRKSSDQNRSDSKTTNGSQIPPPNTVKAQTSSTPTSTTPTAQITTSTTNIPAAQNTNIPKPMAAIKGTTKLSSNVHNQTNTSQKSTNEQQFIDIKNQKLADISNQNNNISTNQDDNGKMQIIAPILIENAANQQHQMLANHLQMQQALNQQNISMSDSCNSKSTHSSSTSGPISNSCESSHIYRQSSESSASDAISMRSNQILSPSNKLILANRTKNGERYGGMHEHNGSMMKASSNGSIASSASSSMTAMSSSTNNTNVNKFNTVPTKQIQNVNGVIYEEEKQMTVMPMRPLLRGYNSHLTLPTRGNHRNQHIAYDYNDDMAQGYCSDGDALRKQAPVRYSDIENGYMSEGGGVSTTNGNVMHHKPILLRARTQLPTTMEER